MSMTKKEFARLRVGDKVYIFRQQSLLEILVTGVKDTGSYDRGRLISLHDEPYDWYSETMACTWYSKTPRAALKKQIEHLEESIIHHKRDILSDKSEIKRLTKMLQS